MEKITKLLNQFKFLRYLPALLFLVTYSFYFVKGANLFFWVFLILFLSSGALILYIDIKNPAKNIKKTISQKVRLLLILMVLVFVYLITLKYPLSFDLTKDKLYSLTPKTKEIIKSLPGNVKIIVFQDSKTQDFNTGPNGQKIFDHVRKLLEEYGRVSPNLDIQFINPDSDTLTTSRYQPKGIGDIVIDSDLGRRYINKMELAKWKMQQNPYTQQPERTIEAYLAEEKISSALLSLVEQGKPVVLWLEGDGEVDIEGQESASLLKEELENNLFEVKKISSYKKSEYKGDLLVIAGPTKEIPDETLKSISNFLKQGKPLILFMGPTLDTLNLPLKSMIQKEYKVELLNYLVFDDSQAFETKEKIIPNYTHHPINHAIMKKKLALVFPVSSALKTGEGSYTLLEASNTAWAETDLKKFKATGKFSNNAPSKTRISLAAYSENKESKSRAIILANTDFIKDRWIQFAGNKDFIVNSFNYLLQRKAPLSISKAVEKENFLMINEGQKQFFFFLFIILIPVMIIAIGIWTGFKRRKLKNPEA